jgi:hypothetical protein
MPDLFKFLPVVLLSLFFGACATRDREHKIIVSVPEQRMIVFKKDVPIAQYGVSTSKFGIGDRSGSCATPLGVMEVAKKIGDGAPLGAVFKSRHRTGEIVRRDAPGRDPIVTRILWLKGLERQNSHAFSRCIYIHGTPEERNIGTPVSYGCVRMRSADVAYLFNMVGVGARVEIVNAPFGDTLAAQNHIEPAVAESRHAAKPL